LGKIIDAHIHLDHYKIHDIENILYKNEELEALIGVSYDYASCKQNLSFAHKHPKLKPAFGWHPEQALIMDNEFADLMNWMKENLHEMIAVGEVGLPYYLHKENPFPIEGYIQRLETFISFRKEFKNLLFYMPSMRMHLLSVIYLKSTPLKKLISIGSKVIKRQLHE
jgi:TatD DNase family protein